MPLSDVIGRVPFLGGYEGQNQINQQRTSGQLAQAGGLMNIIGKAQAHQERQRAIQEEAMLKQVVSQAGSPEAAIQALIKQGTPQGIRLAGVLANAAKDLRQKDAEPFSLSPGQIRYGPDGKVIAQAPAVPKEETPPEIVKLLKMAETLPPGSPMRAAIERRVQVMNKDPSTIIHMPRPEQPLVSIVGEDGKPTLSRREDAIGKTPWVGSPDQLALKVTGGRESVYVQRMMMGANQASKDLANVVQLPLTATSGVFGGRKQGPGLFDAGKEVLANKATGQEAQAYNAMATGFQRSLAQIESAGLMPSGALTHQMDAVLFKEGDTNLTKMHKLAQTRQIVEAGMEVIEANPRVSPEEKAKVKTVLESIRKSVPFTHSDLIKLQVAQETNPNATLKSVLAAPVANQGWSIRPK